MQAAVITIARPENITATVQDLLQGTSQGHLTVCRLWGVAERHIIPIVLLRELLVRHLFV